MKKTNLNFTYNYIKSECEKLKYVSNVTVRATVLHGIYKAAYEYVKNGGKRDIDVFLATLSEVPYEL